jgi:hypothetical protein
MRCNMGKMDRLIRLVAGIMILGLYGALPSPWKFLTLIGLLPLGTALTGFCPVYARLGWNRCRPEARGRAP